MMPLDPVQPASSVNQHPMAPPYVDDNPNMELVEKGLRIAENEKRDAVTASYEEAALSSENPQDALDDIEYPNADATTSTPAELSAMKEDVPPRR